MKSDKELINTLRAAPASWTDAAIVVAFDNRFEFVGEDHPDPINRLNCLQKQGGLAIGLAGVNWSEYADRAFLVQVFEEYAGQAWAHRYIRSAELSGVILCQSMRGDRS